MYDTAGEIKDWFQKAVPEPNEKNKAVQLGVHFEEIAEMMVQLSSGSPAVQSQLVEAKQSLLNLAHTCKTLDPEYLKINIEDRKEFLDALCDQIVTAIGCGHMHQMAITTALHEISDSNNSKFDSEGNPIFDENGKIKKGPDYFPPNLEPFV